jgi:uridine phosphorylase
VVAYVGCEPAVPTAHEAGIAYTRGPTWTIDAPYRETVEEIRHYQAEGVLTVEMEAAALFAVGQCRAIEVAAAFVISGSLGELVWDPEFRAPATRDALIELYRVAVQTLAV